VLRKDRDFHTTTTTLSFSCLHGKFAFIEWQEKENERLSSCHFSTGYYH